MERCARYAALANGMTAKHEGTTLYVCSVPVDQSMVGAVKFLALLLYVSI